MTTATRLSDALELKLERKLGRLSKGDTRRVQLTLALAHRPPLLLLDEPTAGLDPHSRRDLLGKLAAMRESGMTLALSSHQMGDMARLAEERERLRRDVDGQLPEPVGLNGSIERLVQVQIRRLHTDPEARFVAGVVGGDPPVLHAAEPGVDTGADRQLHVAEHRPVAVPAAQRAARPGQGVLPTGDAQDQR